MGLVAFAIFWIVLWPIGAFSNYRVYRMDPNTHHEHEDARMCLRLVLVGMLAITIATTVFALGASPWWLCVSGFLYAWGAWRNLSMMFRYA